jgi:hypothetical protein
MNYTKPEVLASGSALAEIQGVPKPFANLFDAPTDEYNRTNMAYEADE